ncbi:hypothetical protein [Streptomyces liangshanensis]|uniref:Uncharacterized protein n=1 Tax=Streptomyces liangshanensis TaxID=2717324 RepID=A0A6G9GXT5_9ACTN|nr:hypothetical protein [Streptomyces liangshanensis]QIQ02707.1 hypothetical protein HA039_10595 [Streptomyces liangshanensis]
MNSFSHGGIGSGHHRRDRGEPRRAEPGEWPAFEAALAVVNRDVRATLRGQDPLILVAVPSSEPLPGEAVGREQLYVAMPDGRWHGNPVNSSDLEEGDPPEPDDAAAVLAEVADAAQSTVMELRWRAWPVCPVHQVGTHLWLAASDGPDGGDTDGGDMDEDDTDAADPPAWWCGGGRGGTRHRLSLVGELAATTVPGRP